MSREQKVIVNIWALEDQKIQNKLQKFFWQIQKFLDNIFQIAVYTKSETKVYIISEDKKLTHEINETQKKSEDKVAFKVLGSADSLENLDQAHLSSIYVAPSIATEKRILKGGLGKE
jgi:hypothetical protein